MLGGFTFALLVICGILVAAWFRRGRPGVPGRWSADRTGIGVVLSLGFAVPILGIAGLFLYSDIFVIRATSAPARGSTALTVRVIGHQWWWEIRYPGTHAVTANELHIPVGTRVDVEVQTRDVIHSFWVPQLNRKVDTIPGQTNRLLLFAEHAGRYRGQCAEYCGLQHAHMALYVYADPPARFRAWLARESRPARGRGGRGLAVFTSQCASCHAIRGTSARGFTGPDLTHVASRASLAALAIPNTREHLREWIRDPQHVKPGNQMPALPLDSSQLAAVTSYLETLK
jgi:cytochrome c oxidase subunit 2